MASWHEQWSDAWEEVAAVENNDVRWALRRMLSSARELMSQAEDERDSVAGSVQSANRLASQAGILISECRKIAAETHQKVLS